MIHNQITWTNTKIFYAFISLTWNFQEIYNNFDLYDFEEDAVSHDGYFSTFIMSRESRNQRKQRTILINFNRVDQKLEALREDNLLLNE